VTTLPSRLILALAALALAAPGPLAKGNLAWARLANVAQANDETLMAARPNPYNRGNCFQWKRCLGETIGNMWVDSPEFCGPLGGKSWKGQDGQCVDLLETPWSVDPQSLPKP
jgi:hypothetical protein